MLVENIQNIKYERTGPSSFLPKSARACARSRAHALSLKQEHWERKRRGYCRHGNGFDGDFLSIRFAILEETKSVSGRYICIYYIFLGEHLVITESKIMGHD